MALAIRCWFKSWY